MLQLNPYYCIGIAYDNGNGVEVDKQKAIIKYWELAAMNGDTLARFNVGAMEAQSGNWNRALKHYMIAVKGGTAKSLSNIKNIYSRGHATKEEYTKALHSYQAYLEEIKSNQRDEAAAFREDFKYYYEPAV